MVFSGEASWRWRMMAPSTDRSYETFWRQAIRWLASTAPDPVSLSATGGTTPGETVQIDTTIRNEAFQPIRDASVAISVSGPADSTHEFHPALTDADAGMYRAEFRPEQPGVYRVRAEARHAGKVLGTPEEWLLVGGADMELADPRLNEDVLRRLATASGGRYLPATSAGELSALLTSRAPEPAPARRRDLWHNGWLFTVLIALLCGEWIVRRQAGMR
jgi:hypothetical protein